MVTVEAVAKEVRRPGSGGVTVRQDVKALTDSELLQIAQGSVSGLEPPDDDQGTVH
jgi:hypothetical protein